jgi:serine protease Do
MTPIMHSRFLSPIAGLVLLASAFAAGAAERALPELSTLVESNSPAVVNISTTQTIKRSGFQGIDPDDIPEGSPLGDLLRRYYGENGAPEFFDGKSLGSGFLISSDGYILTCAHVVENAKDVTVRLNDRREFSARVVGYDRRSDVAVLKIDAANLPKVVIGDPSRLRVGDWVLAIGSPFGFDSTATAGIVSAKGRALPRENYVPFIQTDVAINPGNSGGPLFNMKGEVVGINSQIYSRTGGFMGLSFAVPIDIAMQVANQIKAHGRVRRGWLGVTIDHVSRDLAESFGLKRPQGAVVTDILPDSPASRADLRIGDVILDLDGQRIDTSSDLPPLVGRIPPGTTVRLGVMRERQMIAVPLTIGELPDDGAASRPAARPEPEKAGQLGMLLRDLTPQQRKQLNLNAGVLVEKVAAGPAYEAGVRPGDIIQQFNGKVVKDATHFRHLAATAPKNQPLPLLVKRNGAAQFLALRIRG